MTHLRQGSGGQAALARTAARDPRLIEAQLGMSRAIARLRPSRLRTDLLSTLRFSLGRDAFAEDAPALRHDRALRLLAAALDLAEREGVARLDVVALVNRETMGRHLAMDRADAIDLIAESLVRLVAGEPHEFGTAVTPPPEGRSTP